MSALGDRDLSVSGIPELSVAIPLLRQVTNLASPRILRDPFVGAQVVPLVSLGVHSLDEYEQR